MKEKVNKEKSNMRMKNKMSGLYKEKSDNVLNNSSICDEEERRKVKELEERSTNIKGRDKL